MREAAGARQDDVNLVVEGTDDAADEGRVQERRVGGRGVGGLRAPVERREAGRQALERAAPFAGVLDHLDRLGQ